LHAQRHVGAKTHLTWSVVMIDHLHEEVALHAATSSGLPSFAAGDLGISMQSAQHTEVTSK
jgi:hypothetical protein